MQPREVIRYIDGVNEARKDADQRRAYFVSWIVNTQVKDPVNPIDIFEPLYYSPEEADERKDKRKYQAKKKEKTELLKTFGLDRS